MSYKGFFFLFLALVAICFSAKRNQFNNFGGELLEEHCANILNSGLLAKDDMSFEDFFSLFFFIFLSGGHLVQWSGIIAAILVFRSTQFKLVRSRGHPVASEQVLAQNDQMAVAAILDFRSAQF